MIRPLHRLELLKRVASLIIAACLFLPLCQCTPKAVPGAQDSVQTQAAPAEPEVLVIGQRIDYQDPHDLFGLLLFAWPLLAWPLRRRVTRVLTTAIVNLAELTAAVATLIYLYDIIALWGQIRYGGVMALGAYGVYCLAAIGTLIGLLRKMLSPLPSAPPPTS
ncbi:MAG: hypothetical protein JO218_07835 [Burkholderiales bacterium]|nr:hypothetical protein [Burkholderiales bacterium]